MIYVEGQLLIGKYLLEEGLTDEGDGGLWISIAEGEAMGEGGQFDAEKLEALIDRFYLENF